MKIEEEGGFTFIEVLAASYSNPAHHRLTRYDRSYENEFVATMMSDLRNAATVQELYHRLP